MTVTPITRKAEEFKGHLAVLMSAVEDEFYSNQFDEDDIVRDELQRLTKHSDQIRAEIAGLEKALVDFKELSTKYKKKCA